MITREQVIEMAAEEFDILKADCYCNKDNIVDSGNLWITGRIERLVHAAYKRGIEDAAKIVKYRLLTNTIEQDSWDSGWIAGNKGALNSIRALLEE